MDWKRSPRSSGRGSDVRLGNNRNKKPSADVFQTVLKIIKKENSRQDSEAFEEAAEVPLLPPAKNMLAKFFQSKKILIQKQER